MSRCLRRPALLSHNPVTSLESISLCVSCAHLTWGLLAIETLATLKLIYRCAIDLFRFFEGQETALNLFIKYVLANYRLATSLRLFRNSVQVIEPALCFMFCVDKDGLARSVFLIKISRRNKQVGLRGRQFERCGLYSMKRRCGRALDHDLGLATCFHFFRRVRKIAKSDS